MKIISLGDQVELIPNQHKFTLIFLHGLNDTNHDLIDLFTNHNPCGKDFKIVLLQAKVQRVSLAGGNKLTSWFDIRQFQTDVEGFEEYYSLPQILDSQARINKSLEEEIQILGGCSKKVFLGGFSQGAVMSLFCGLQFNQPIGGIIANSGFLFAITNINENNRNTPILVNYGQSDELLPFELFKYSYDNLDSSNQNITKNFWPNTSHYQMFGSKQADKVGLQQIKDFLVKFTNFHYQK